MAIVKTILIAGTVAGTLDILDAFLFSYARSAVPPDRVLQAVASGLLGRPSYQGGWATAALGLALHFFIATTVSAVYVLASRRLPVLIQHAVPAGIGYGIAVYFVMQYGVLPWSAFRGGPFTWAALTNGILIHAFGVGLPIALVARHFLVAESTP